MDLAVLGVDFVDKAFLGVWSVKLMKMKVFRYNVSEFRVCEFIECEFRVTGLNVCRIMVFGVFRFVDLEFLGS